jgi:hypothetical protein
MKAQVNFQTVLFVLALFFLVSCDPNEPLIIDPPQNCDLNTESLVNADTANPFYACTPTWLTDTFTTGIQVVDIEFNPTDRNMLAVYIIRQLTTNLLGSDTPIHELWIIDLCKNTSQLLIPNFILTNDRFHWGLDGRIYYNLSGLAPWRCITPSGSEIIDLPFLAGTNYPIVTQEGSILVPKIIGGEYTLIEFNLEGQALDTTLNTLGKIRAIPNNRLLGLSDGRIVIVDRQTGIETVVDPNTDNVSFTDLAWSDSLQAVLWSTSTNDVGNRCGYTSLNTGQRTVLGNSAPNRRYYGVEAGPGQTIAAIRMDIGFIAPCFRRRWIFAVLFNPDGTDERRLELPF